MPLGEKDEGQGKKEEVVRHCTRSTFLRPFSPALHQEKEGAFFISSYVSLITL
jgi:hypothetical protein